MPGQRCLGDSRDLPLDGVRLQVVADVAALNYCNHCWPFAVILAPGPQPRCPPGWRPLLDAPAGGRQRGYHIMQWPKAQRTLLPFCSLFDVDM